MVMGIRQRIVEDTDSSSSQVKSEDEDEDLTDEQIKAKATAKGEPSSEAASKFTDYSTPSPAFDDTIPYRFTSDSIHQR